MKRKNPPQKRNKKFIQLLEGEPFRELKRQGKKRGIGIQEMIRAVIIPEWLEHERAKTRR